MNILREKNNQLGVPNFELEETDLADAYAVRFVIENHNCPKCGEPLPNGWGVLRRYWEAARDSILVAGMDGIRTRAKRDLSDLKWAILKGFVECCAIPERILRRADEFVAQQKKAAEQENLNESDEE